MSFIEVNNITKIMSIEKPKQARLAFSLSLEAFSFCVLSFCSFIVNKFFHVICKNQ